jgi:hypothetical protein
VKLFLFRTKLQDCFLFVKKKFCEIILDKLVTNALFSVDLERLMVGSSFAFWAIMQIPTEGKISFILPLEEPAPCTPWQYHWGDICLNGHSQASSLQRRGQNVRPSSSDE